MLLITNKWANPQYLGFLLYNVAINLLYSLLQTRIKNKILVENILKNI